MMVFIFSVLLIMKGRFRQSPFVLIFSVYLKILSGGPLVLANIRATV